MWTYGELVGAGAPAHGERAVGAGAVAAGVGAGRVRPRVVADDGEARGRLDGERGVLVLEQDDAVARDRPRDVVVLRLRSGVAALVAVDPRVELYLGEGGVILADGVPGGENAESHVIEALLRDVAGLDGGGQVGSPEEALRGLVVVSAGHGHVQASDSALHGGVVRSPVSHDETLVVQLILQETVQDLVVFASPSAVQFVLSSPSVLSNILELNGTENSHRNT